MCPSSWRVGQAAAEQRQQGEEAGEQPNGAVDAKLHADDATNRMRAKHGRTS
jgi:hypothetical protein